MQISGILSDPLSNLSRCLQCGVSKPNLILLKIVYAIEGIMQNGASAPAWTIYQCNSCYEICCFKTLLPIAQNSTAAREQLNLIRPPILESMPSSSEDFSDWPENARKYAIQAIECINAPDGAVMLAGSAVDAMLKSKGFNEGSVYTRISSAVSAGILTPEMGDWAHEVRLASNNPRHADLESPHASKQEAKSVLEFVKALGMFLYTLPARVEQGRKSTRK